MIARLSELSQIATPTPFHQLLRSLDDRGKLLRVYTQNIDAIELKSGLSFGVPEFDSRRKPRLKGKGSVTEPIPQTPEHRLPSPPTETPRCIPLHGTLQSLHCQTCNHSFPLEDHLPCLTSGSPPACPECTVMEETRQLVGKRARGVGKLRPSVVLYNETHKDGEGVGEVVRKDLVGSSKGKGRSGADLLLVVGTSLRVPGTKRIVREFAKAVRSRGSSKEGPIFGLLTPTPSPRRSPTSDEEPPMKTIYLNLDFPVPTREWEGVFDVWLQGDVQRFAEMLSQEVGKELRNKEVANERKRKREEEIEVERRGEATRPKKTSKRGSVSPTNTTKRRKMIALSSRRKAKASTADRKANTLPRQRKTSIPPTKPKPCIPTPPPPKPVYGPGHNVLIPEVFITTTPPKSALTRSQTVSQRLLTPGSTPSGHWKRAAAYDVKQMRSRPHAREISSVVHSDAKGSDDDLLPNNFLVR
jgi:NAD-dependent SIR2 family protein deacetylase